MVIPAAFSLGSLLYIMYAAIGLGLVIVFHELGHFAMAKWCNVNVERFSIGFGPVLLRYKRGETEYALSAIPFGGYVKMLGQDDMDPSQLSSEQIAEDPRSYSAKSVPQRMAIISAGVIMNVITAVLFYAVAFGVGVTSEPPVVGIVQVGSSAWKAGVRAGDTITRINNRDIETFMDISRAVLLSEGDVVVEGVHHDGETWKARITPDQDGRRRSIGVVPTRSLKVVSPIDPADSPTQPGMSASEAGFQPGDEFREINGQPVTRFIELQQAFSAHRDETVSLKVARKSSGDSADSELVELKVGPNRVQTLGLWMDVGRVSAIRDNSPAAEAGLQPGDKLTRVNDREIGTDLDPLRLPDLLADLHGQEVSLTVSRPVKGANPETVTLQLVPEDLPGWTEPVGSGASGAVSLTAIGAAFQVTRTVLHVVPGSPADGHIKPGERIQKVELTPPQDGADGKPAGGKPLVLDLTQDADPKQASNWGYAFSLLQQARNHKLTLTVSSDGELRTETLEPVSAEDWYYPARGVELEVLRVEQVATGPRDAVALGYQHTRNNILDIYLTLRNLFTGELSFRELHGPIGIATVAYEVASRGVSDLLVFLGFLSVNLAVLNFLPIPVLDGGHMVFLIWEGVTRRKPSEKVLNAATYVGLTFVLGLMLLVMYLDVFVHRLGWQ